MAFLNKIKLRRFARFITSAKLFAYILPWLMVILVAGTIAEKTQGLYTAQRIFFSSYVIWLWDIIPLPGILTIAVFIFLALLFKLAIDHWRLRNLGTIIAHVGVIVLLFGGFVTAHFSHEGVMVIPTGQSRDYIEDRYKNELVIDVLSKDKKEVVFSEGAYGQGKILKNAEFPFEIDIVSAYPNCELSRLDRPHMQSDYHGDAINYALKPLANNPIEEKNTPGLFFHLKNSDDADRDYIYLNASEPLIIAAQGKKYSLSIRPARTSLPFALKLLNFKEDFYPGTDKPSAYQSDVLLLDKGVNWHSLISMNEPLRYKGYAFYQASFTGNGDNATTVLAVMENKGRLFPYISGTLIALGILIHLFQRIFLSSRRTKSP